MKIEAVDFFYLKMPVVTDAGDGSQDALLVRVKAGAFTGWGECDASPLTSIAAYYTPMSHGACKSVQDVVLGWDLNEPADISALAEAVEHQCMDLLQAPHTFSGIEIAMWDILGHKYNEPVYKLLGYDRGYPKKPYASQMFGHTPQETLAGCRSATEKGYRAVKCGWEPFGYTTVEADREQLAAAREGVGPDCILLIDAGQIWREDLEAATARLPILEEFGVTWLEEPFHGKAYEEYAQLGTRCKNLRIAGGENSHNYHMAKHLVDFGNVSFVQIDCGRIGGIGSAKRVADYAVEKGITYVNHTFTSHLALSASLQPFAGLSDHVICEYPFAPKPVALAVTKNHIELDSNGHVSVPHAPGLGMIVDETLFSPYLVDLEIIVENKLLYKTPSLTG